MAVERNLEDLILQLYEVEGIKFGEFTLKTGLKSPIYFDLRVIVSYPTLLKNVSDLFWQLIRSENIKCDSVCGVPYTALPIATCISVTSQIPMLLKRSEAKKYGTKKRIEGSYKPNDNCLIIEDTVTSGSSVLETALVLRDEGLVVTDAFVLLNREQGGKANIKKHGITLHSLCGINKLLDILHSHNKISAELVSNVQEFLDMNRTTAIPKISLSTGIQKMKFIDRADKSTNQIAKKLFKIMEDKQTNLAVAVDVTLCGEVLRIANLIGPHICVLKLHVDILSDFDLKFVSSLVKLSLKHQFLIFEDRKFADIGNTVQLQFTKGIYEISEWANIVNAHIVPGPAVIKALKQASEGKNCALLLIAQMSSTGALTNAEHSEAARKWGEENRDFVIGFISQSTISQDPALIHFTPGVKMAVGGDSLGQQYISPEDAVQKRGADVVIVGRGITQAEDVEKAARMYKEAAFNAYSSLVQN